MMNVKDVLECQPLERNYAPPKIRVIAISRASAQEHVWIGTNSLLFDWLQHVFDLEIRSSHSNIS